MPLNTYAESLPFFTLKPRETKSSENETIITFLKPCSILTGRVWVGYDEGARFEAALKIWLKPKTPNGLSGNVYLGGVYMHKHSLLLPLMPNVTTNYSIPSQNDYHHLQELDKLSPIPVLAGSMIVVDREIFNIQPLGNNPFNAWDCEVLLVVSE